MNFNWDSETLKKLGRVSFWIGMIPMTFFMIVLIYGLYLGLSDQEKFTFTNSQEESLPAQD